MTGPPTPPPPVPPPTAAKRAEQVNAERIHFEGLLQSRINFHLVFAGIFMAAETTIKDRSMRLVTLSVTTVVSLLFTLAIVRTYRLVMKALDEIVADDSHPYAHYKSQISFPWNANNFLVAVPLIITCMFAYMLIHYCRESPGTGDDDRTCAIYQDGSDRRVFNTYPPVTAVPKPKSLGKPPVHQ